MRAILFILIFLSNLVIADSFPDLDSSGSANVTNQHYSSISISGNLDAKNIIVEKSTSISGYAKIDSSQLNKLSASGELVLIKSIVKGKIEVSGGTKIHKNNINGSKFNCSGDMDSSLNIFNAELNLSGGLNSYRDIFNNQINMSGNIKANKTEFNKILILSSDSSFFKDSKINDNIVNYSKNESTVITLDNTIVKGNIEFKKAKGLVILKNKARVEKEIINANIKNESL